MKTKHIILTLTFFALACFVKAQDKYEFMVIEYKTILYRSITVSIDGEFYSVEAIELPKSERFGNANPILKKIKEFQDKGWELMKMDTQMGGVSTGSDSEVYFAYLRKKKS